MGRLLAVLTQLALLAGGVSLTVWVWSHPEEARAALSPAAAAPGDADDHAPGGAPDEGDAAPPRIARGDDGRVTVHLSADEVAALGLEVAPAAAATWTAGVDGYGVVEPDPDARSTVRAPVAGVWRGDEATVALGDALTAGQPLGAVAPRVVATPLELDDRAGRLADAKAEVRAADAANSAAQHALARLDRLNRDGQAASDRSVEEARVAAVAARAHLDAARAAVQRLEAAPPSDLEAVPVLAPRGGVVVEQLARPGEWVDAGAALLVLEEPGPRLVRATFPPPGVPGGVAGGRAGVTPLGGREASAGALLLRVAPAPGASPGETWLVRVNDARLGPGVPVHVRAEAPGPALEGVCVPAAALVRAGAQAFAYVQRPEGFLKVVVTTERPLPDGYFLEGALGGPVVTIGAASLLGAELFAAYAPAEDDE